MTSNAVLVLAAGVLVVLVIAGAALALDARRRRSDRPRPARPSRPAPPVRPSPPGARARQTERIDNRLARQDPPTVLASVGRHAEPTGPHPTRGPGTPAAPVGEGAPADRDSRSDDPRTGRSRTEPGR